MLINKSYFTGPLTIAQLGQQSVVDDLNNCIAYWEPRILSAALGNGLADAFMAGLEVGSDEVIADRWQKLLTGVTFTNLSQLQVNFYGFAGKYSAHAGCIYYEYMKDLNTQATGIGIVKNQGQNSQIASPSGKMIAAFNESSRQMSILWDYLYINRDFYPEYPSYYWGNGFGNRFGQEEYDFHPINSFGI